MLKPEYYIAAGAVPGVGCRHGLGLFFTNYFDIAAFSWVILLVNLIGCFAIGSLYGYLADKPAANNLKAFWGTGFLGSFTTFSAFSADTLLLTSLQTGWMTGYLTVSITFGLLMVYAGLKVGERFQ